MLPFSIGIDIGGTKIKIGVVHKQTIIDRIILDAGDHTDFRSNLDTIDRTLTDLCKRNSIQSIETIGFAFPGIIDMNRKTVISTPQKFEDAREIDLPRWAHDSWGAGFIMDNDARAALVGEKRYGAAREYSDAVIMTLGTGIGTSVMIDNRLLYGRHFQAGCLGGHLTVRYDGNTCKCGNIGCAEAEASTLVLDAYVRAQPDFPSSLLARKKEIDFYQLIRCVKKNDVLSLRTLNHFITVWAATAVSLIHAYDPQILVLFGGIMRSGRHILPEMQRRIEEHAWTPWGTVSVVASELADDAAILGITSDVYESRPWEETV